MGFRDEGDQCARFERLGEMIIKAGGAAAATVFFLAIAGDRRQDYRVEIRLARKDLATS